MNNNDGSIKNKKVPVMSKTILLVDDEEGIRKVLGIALSDMGYKVISAENGETALGLFRDARPQIVLTDIKMPNMDGIELLSAIKKEAPDTEVIMITGHGDIDLAIKSLKFEATDFVTKPVNDEVLEIALKRAEERISMKQLIREYTENLEQLVEEKSRKLVEAERMAAVGKTIAGLSHAIKNIASGLKGGTFVIEKGMDLHNEKYLREGWDMIKANIDKIKNLSLDLLNYGKSSDAIFMLCNPNAPAKEVVELMKPAADEKKITLSADLSENLKPLYFDHEGIHRCILNLVTNAIDAATDETSGKSAKKITVRTLKVEGWGVEYQVIDNCGGMPEKIKNQIFKNFFSTKGSFGTGIGLMLTKKIIDEHKGLIEFVSEEGTGSAFTIKLPEKYKL
jgi:signal transduction histidine kinase